MATSTQSPRSTRSPRTVPLLPWIRKRRLADLKERAADLEQKITLIRELTTKAAHRKFYTTHFYEFCKDICGFKQLTDDLHRPVCDQIADPSAKRKLFLLPRGHFKTTIISICYPLWLLIRDQDHRIALVSKAASKSEENLEELIDRARRKEFQELYGEVIGHPDTWPICRRDRVKIARRGSTTGPSIAAYSTESSEVGRHFDTMLFDDIVDQENVNTERLRQSTWEWLGRQFAVCDPGREIVVIGTRWHWDDVYSRIGKAFSRFDRESHPLGWLVMRRAAVENGKSIFPSRFTPEVLAELKHVMGDYVYSCFYMNDPTGEGANPFFPKRFTWIEYKQNPDAWTYILIDPGQEKEVHSCHSGIIIGDALPERKFVIREAYLEKLNPDDLINRIFELVEKHNPYKVVIEDEVYQKSLYWWCRREMIRARRTFLIDMIKNPRNLGQEGRLLALQPFVHGGGIVFSLGMPGRADLMEEFETFPKGPHKDLLCALYFATQIWYPGMPRTVEGHAPLDPRVRLLTTLIENQSRARKRGRGILPMMRFG